MAANKVDFYTLGNKLWNIANIFRDDTLKTTEYLEEFSYFLFLKLFDEQEKQKEEIAKTEGKPFEPDLPEELRFHRWATKIINNEIDITQAVKTVQDIFQKLATIEDKHGKDLSLFRRLFNKHIWRIKYGATIRDLLKKLIDLELEQNFDVMGRAYEFVVQKLGEQKQYGQYFTPRHIIHFMVELAQPQIDEKIYDPAAGTGGFILRSFGVVRDKIKESIKKREITNDRAEKLLRDLKNKHLWAVEKAPDVFKLAMMNMILHNDGKSNLKEADSLDNRAQQEYKEQFNLVLSNPPYGPLTQSRTATFDYHVKRFEALFIQHIMNSLSYSKENEHKPSRAVVIILDKILFDNTNAFKNIRKKLLREYNLKAVFSMPAGIFQPYSGVKTTVMYFERPTKEEWKKIKDENSFATKKVLFFDIKSDGFTLSTQRRPINGAFQGENPNIYEPPCGDLPKAVEIFKKWNEWLENPSDDLPDFVDNKQVWIADIEEIKEKDFNLNPGLYKKFKKGKVKWELISLKEVLLSLESGKRPKGGVSNIDSGVVSIGGEHIDESGGLKFESIKYIPEDFFNTLSKGIVQEKDILVVKDGATTGKVAIIKKLPFEKATINEHVFLLRVDEDKILPEFLFYTLWTDFGQKQILNNKKGAAQGGISRDFVENVYIPVPHLEIQKQIVERLDKQQAVIEKAKEMEKAIIDAGIDDAIFEGDWEWVELGEVVEINPETRNPSNNPNEKFIYIDISSVDGDSGKIREFKIIKGKEAPTRARRIIRLNDVIVSTVRPYLKGFTIIKDKNLDNQICSTGFAVLRSTNQILPEYLFFFVRSNLFLKQIIGNMQGSNYPAVSNEDIKYSKIPLPPLEKQQEIVAFLDTQFKTLEHIRKLKENAEKTIKLILEKEVFTE